MSVVMESWGDQLGITTNAGGYGSRPARSLSSGGDLRRPVGLAGTTFDLIIRPRRIVHRLERFLELRRDRDVDFFAGRQPRDEPFVVERNKIAVRTELAEGAFHHRGQLRLAPAGHDAVGGGGTI